MTRTDKSLAALGLSGILIGIVMAAVLRGMV